MIIKIDIDRQNLIRRDCEEPHSGSVGYLSASFRFLSPDWEGLKKTALFMSGGQCFAEPLDSEGCCAVPAEAIQPGKMYVSLRGDGLTDTVFLPTAPLEIDIINAGAAPGRTPPAPRPDIYSNLLSAVARQAYDAKTAESFARGGTGYRDGEDIDNAKYYSQSAERSKNKIVALSADAHTLLPGIPASVTVTETETALSLDFGIPQGERGERGERGETGATGPQGPQGPAGGVIAMASQLPITDAGEYFNASDTEAMGQELGLALKEKTPYGVYSGLAVSAQSSPNMTVKISAGIVYLPDGRRFALPATASFPVNAADASNPRIDLIYISASGAAAYLGGTAAASPSAPSVPSGGVSLAEITVAALATAVTAAAISDKRQTLNAGPLYTPTLINGWSATSGFAFGYRKTPNNYVELSGAISGGTVNANYSTGYVAFTLPAGYRPAQAVGFNAVHYDSAITATFSSVQVLIAPSGNVYIFGPTANNKRVYFDGIRFSAS